MSNALTQLAKLTNKIEMSPNCGYLCQYFDELVALLEPLKSETLPPVLIRDLKGLIQNLAAESTYDNSSSVNRMKYSARSFYCADNLVKYLPENQQEFFYNYLNDIFAELINSGVAPIIEKGVFEKYIKMRITDDNCLKVYDEQIRKAIKECDKTRLWSTGEACLACDYMKSIDRMIRTYVKLSGDYSLLHEWIPLLRISHVTKYKTGYLDSTWYEHAGENEREDVMCSLNKIVQIQGYLHCFWYWNAPEELISTLSTEELIDMFEAFDDRMFDDILSNMAELQHNSKVQDVLEYFACHKDKVVAGFAGQLLDCYKNHK